MERTENVYVANNTEMHDIRIIIILMYRILSDVVTHYYSCDTRKSLWILQKGDKERELARERKCMFMLARLSVFLARASCNGVASVV